MNNFNFHSAIKSTTPVLVDFYADWCEPCKWLEPVLDETQKLLGDEVEIVKLNIDQYPELKKQYHILSVPVLAVFKNGELLWRMNGFLYAKELSEKVKEFI